VANHDQSLVLFTDVASRRSGSNSESLAILLIDCEGSKAAGGQHAQTMLGLPEDNLGSAIVDIEIWDSYLALTFEKNLIAVFDLAQKNNKIEKPVFRAKFADATETIS
jgi:hypothetical protein